MVKILIFVEMLFIFSTPASIRFLWKLKIVVYMHRCLIHVLQTKNKTLFCRSVSGKESSFEIMHTGTKAQCYKTLNGCDLQVFIKTRVFVPGKPSQHSLFVKSVLLG